MKPLGYFIGAFLLSLFLFGAGYCYRLLKIDGSGIFLMATLALFATFWGLLNPSNSLWLCVVLAAEFIGVVMAFRISIKFYKAYLQEAVPSSGTGRISPAPSEGAPAVRRSTKAGKEIEPASEGRVSFDWQFDKNGLTPLERVVKHQVKNRKRRS